MLRHIATALRFAASRIDGSARDAAIADRLHKDAVAGMNRYIGRTERFVCALENAARAAGISESELDALRRMHGRFDTAKILHAWKDPAPPPDASQDTARAFALALELEAIAEALRAGQLVGVDVTWRQGSDPSVGVMPKEPVDFILIQATVDA